VEPAGAYDVQCERIYLLSVKVIIKTSNTCPGRLPPTGSRRRFLQQSSAGFGSLALTSLLSQTAKPQDAHFPATVKNVIFCFMDGGPSHVDTFDYKPLLTKHQGQKIGDRRTSKRSQSDPNRVWLGSPWEFKQ
jgi:hypothetical protein